jgi:hypothetical protein
MKLWDQLEVKPFSKVFELDKKIRVNRDRNPSVGSLVMSPELRLCVG